MDHPLPAQIGGRRMDAGKALHVPTSGAPLSDTRWRVFEHRESGRIARPREAKGDIV